VRQLSLTAIVLASLALSACAFVQPDRIHYVWEPEPFAPAAVASAPSSDALVGVALSGGGSRAATFAAAALEALHEHGLLAQTTHMSSVSGGGFAAAWWALNRPELCAERGGDLGCAEAAFDAFETAMRHDFLLDVTGRQVLRPNRISSPTRRLSSLADALDGAFVGGATFGDLPASPVMLFNAARLDDGRRFVFSNAVIPDEAAGRPSLADPRLRAASFSLPGCPRPTPAGFSLSLAVATSAAFPVYLGPATIAASNDCAGETPAWWHLADGGVIENLGLETLEEAALRALDSPVPPARVLILSIDGEALPDAAQSFADPDLSIWTSDPARIVDVAMARGRAYHNLVWPGLFAAAPAPVTEIAVRYTDAALDAWPSSCSSVSQAGAAIADSIAAVATSLRITACDADLMAAAAHQLVHAALNAHVATLAAEGFTLRAVAPH
jgi:predicted acylesterase/phospholipase RssA